MTTTPKDTTAHTEPLVEETHKECASCGENKPIAEFLRRTGRRSRQGARRGTCRDCRKRQQTEDASALVHQDNASSPDTTDKPAESSEAEPQPPPSSSPAAKRRRRGRKASATDELPEDGQTLPPVTAAPETGRGSAVQPESPDGHDPKADGSAAVSSEGADAHKAAQPHAQLSEDGPSDDRSAVPSKRRRRKRKPSAAATETGGEQSQEDEPPASSEQTHEEEILAAPRTHSSSTSRGRRTPLVEDDESLAATQPPKSLEPSGSPESYKPGVMQEDEPLRAPRKRKRKRKRKGKAPAAQMVQTPSPGATARIKSLPADPKLPKHASLMQVETPDVSALRTTRKGIVWMRGRTEKGKRWHQETDLETAQTLVREHAAVILNPYTVQRLYSNKTFRHYILTRDRYTCYFCGNYGDTIDHLLPRAKGGHTTPLNCVCACNLCNQSKADRDMDEFMQNYVPPPAGMETE